jgi:hypothetical protein
MTLQDVILQTTHLAGGLFHSADFLQIEQTLVLRNVEIAKRLWQHAGNSSLAIRAVTVHHAV